MQAARFTSLIPYEDLRNSSSNNAEHPWADIGSFLNKKKGSAIEHSILLCSLLLGFKVDAYICLGSCSEGSHAWVITRSKKKVQVGSNNNFREALDVKIWESLTGKTMGINDPRVGLLYRRVGCVFNDKRLYANLQKDDLVGEKISALNSVGDKNAIWPRKWIPLEIDGRRFKLYATSSKIWSSTIAELNSRCKDCLI